MDCLQTVTVDLAQDDDDFIVAFPNLFWQWQLYCLFHPQPYILLVGRAAALFQSNPASIKLLLLESISNMDDTQCLSFLADTKRNMKAR